jgi:uncharacterized protein (DUF433 family)
MRYTESMSQVAAAENIPLEVDSQGVLRIAGTPVTLKTVVEAYKAGITAEEIARRFPSLQLADVYAVLTYYLRHQTEVDTLVQVRREETAPTVPLIPEPPPGTYLIREPETDPTFPDVDLVGELANQRSQILSRKHSGDKLSSGEEKDLEILTARLKESLPPISPHELEALLEMTREVEIIREHARERRRLRLG